MANRNTFLFLALLLLCACGGGSPVDKAARIASAERLRQHTEALAHDSCQGRKPQAVRQQSMTGCGMGPYSCLPATKWALRKCEQNLFS